MKQVWLDVANDMLALSEKGYTFRLTDTPNFSLGSCAEVSLFIYFNGDIVLEAAIDLYAESGARYNMFLHKFFPEDYDKEDGTISLDKEVPSLIEYIEKVEAMLQLKIMPWENLD